MELIVMFIHGLVIGYILGAVKRKGIYTNSIPDFKYSSEPPERGLSRECGVKNVQVKPITDARTKDYKEPKGVRPNTISTLKSR